MTAYGYTGIMFRFLRFVFLCALIFALAACKNTQSGQGAYGPVLVTNAVSFRLLPPDCIEKNLDMFQQINGTYGENRFGVNAWVKADETGIVMELLNDMGSSLGELIYNGRELYFASSFSPRGLKAEYAVADFQFCFYQPAELRAALEPLSLTVQNREGTERRIIRDGERLIAEIEKQPGMVRYTNHLRNYSYMIRGDFP